MVSHGSKLCPRCKKNRYSPYGMKRKRTLDDPPPPSLSRRDNKTYICRSCGTAEALEDMKKRGINVTEEDVF